MAIVRLPNGLVQRLVLDVKEPAPMQRAGRDRPRVPAGDELRQKIVCLLAMGDAGEGEEYLADVRQFLRDQLDR